jgi:hypothetical protein
MDKFDKFQNYLFISSSDKIKIKWHLGERPHSTYLSSIMSKMKYRDLDPFMILEKGCKK